MPPRPDAAGRDPLAKGESVESALLSRVEREADATPEDELSEAFRLLASLLLDSRTVQNNQGVLPTPDGAPNRPDDSRREEPPPPSREAAA